MAHYTKVLDGIVIKIVVAEPDFFNDFIDDSPGEWIQTSYNTRGGKHYDCNTGVEDSGTPFRKNYAGIGYTYDSTRDAFIPPKPYPSWVLDETTCLWNSPVARPSDFNGVNYNWNETDQSWDAVE